MENSMLYSTEACSCTTFENDILSHQNNIDLFCSYLAHISYHSQKFITNILQNISPLRIKFFDTVDTPGFLLETNQYIFFVFRGTDDTSIDLQNDLKFWKMSYRNFKVHCGFLNAFMKIKTLLDEDLIYAKTSKKHIIYSGHSLGGAIATILCLDMLPNTLVTFGCPRVAGCKAFIEYMTPITNKRYVNKGDIISSLPQCFLGYTHHCPAILLTENFGNIFKSHYSTNYVLALKQMIK